MREALYAKIGKALPDTSLLPALARILETSIDHILGCDILTRFEKRASVREAQEGVENLARLPLLIGRESTVWRGIVQGVNMSMNIDLEEMLDDAYLRECLVAELLIQHMRHGRAIDPTEVRSRLKNEKFITIVLEKAKELGIE